MSIRDLLVASALSLGPVLTLAAPAAAQPYGKGGNYSLAPRPAPDRAAKPDQHQASCICPMMKGDDALHRQHMTPGDGPQAPPATPGLPG